MVRYDGRVDNLYFGRLHCDISNARVVESGVSDVRDLLDNGRDMLGVRTALLRTLEHEIGRGYSHASSERKAEAR